MPKPPGWPNDVEQIRIGGLARLGIDTNRQRYWDGEKIEIRRWFHLTKPQQIAAILVTAAAVLGGTGAFMSGLADTGSLYGAHGGHFLVCRLLPAP